MLRKVSINPLRPGETLQGLISGWIDRPFGAFRPQRVTADAGPHAALGPGSSRMAVDAGAAGRFGPAVMGEPAHHLPEDQSQARRLIVQAHATVGEIMANARRGIAPDLVAARGVVESLAESQRQSPGTLLSLVRLKAPPDYTALHAVGVSALMVALAQQLRLPETLAREAGLGGLLHDIGQALIPEALLAKPGELDEEERLTIRAHPERGHALLQKADGISADALDICLHHHERIDGSGYPHRLRRSEISLLAKMAAVCDVYDALTSERPYRAACDPAEALRLMSQWTERFDQGVFRALVRVLGLYPAGSLVRLQSGRLAVVLRQHPALPTAPLVRTFYCTRTRERLPLQELHLGEPGSGDRIVASESPNTWPFRNLDWILIGQAGE